MYQLILHLINHYFPPFLKFFYAFKLRLYIQSVGSVTTSLTSETPTVAAPTSRQPEEDVYNGQAHRTRSTKTTARLTMSLRVITAVHMKSAVTKQTNPSVWCSTPPPWEAVGYLNVVMFFSLSLSNFHIKLCLFNYWIFMWFDKKIDR